MKLRALLILATMVLGGMLLSGVVLAVTKTCNHNCKGTNSSDRLTGSNSNNEIYALGGRDVVSGLRGEDWLYGEGGADVISCGASSGDLVVFDPDLDSVAADCEAPRPRCPSPSARGVGGRPPPQPRLENPVTQCDGLCKCKTCDELRNLKANGSCENKYRQKCT